MLNSLSIKNVALIEETELEFGAGLNILTGETGAGKSMIADSLSFILGQRPSKDFVRAGADCAEVVCVIEVAQANKAKIVEYGIDIDYDNLLIINRTLTDTGKSAARINGKTVAVGVVKEISEILFDIHSQHEHQSLLKTSRHIDILDRFTPPEADDLKNGLSILLKDLNAIEAEIAAISTDDADRQSRMELYAFQINEIESAGLKADEEENLLNRRRLLNNAREILNHAKAALKALSGGDSGLSAMDLLVMGNKALYKLKNLDSQCAPYAEALENIIIQLDETARDLRDYKNNLSEDPGELKQIEDRLDLIYNLKRKYGKTANDILLFLDKTKERYETLINSSERLDRLNKTREELRQKACGICARISAMRAQAANEISKKIEQNLWELEMKNAAFSVSIEHKNDLSASGYDNVEFLISANAGEGLKPLAQTASGGEISRVMLALKTVLAYADTAETLVFDEIDAGISGKTAQKTAEKLSSLAASRQIICITHLPQIAAMADRHFLVEKTPRDGKTIASAHILNEEQIKAELARLIGGAAITEATYAAAAELREMAKITP